MPSYAHELILILLRKYSASAADLLRKLNVHLPEFERIHSESSDINDVKPAEYRADLVLFLVRKSKRVLGVIVEVQLRRDYKKPYAWPAYIANLRSRHRCPVCLLVITTSEAVARWARKPIGLGPGTRCKPWILGPSNTPIVTKLQYAKKNVELAVLSAIEHGRSSNAARAKRTVSAAIAAIADIDSEDSKLYLDLISIFSTPKIREAAMNSLGYEYQSAFARRYVAEGKAAGRIEMILKQLTSRFGPLPDKIQTHVRGAKEAELDTVAERILTEATLEQVLGTNVR